MIDVICILGGLCFVFLMVLIYILSDGEDGAAIIGFIMLIILSFGMWLLGRQNGFSSAKRIEPQLKITCDNSHQDSLVCDTVYVYKIEE